MRRDIRGRPPREELSADIFSVFSLSPEKFAPREIAMRSAISASLLCDSFTFRIHYANCLRKISTADFK